MEVAFERRKEKYTHLSAVCSQEGWKTFTYPVEVGCRGYSGSSTQQILKSYSERYGRGGREGELLALAPKKRQGMWKARILAFAIRRHPCCCSITFRCFGMRGAKHQ